MGEDGGIERRAALDPNLAEILLHVDAMPMRRDDIRAKNEACLSLTAP